MSDNDMPDLSDEGKDSDWEEMDDYETEVSCLFCCDNFLNVGLAIEHLTLVHEFNLFDLKFKFRMDCYSYIKMVNYIRKNAPDPKQLISSEIALWQDDIYLKPVLEADPWLMFDFDHLIETKWHDYSYGDEYDYDNKKKFSIPESQFQNMLAAINALKDELIEKDTLLKLAMEDMKKMSAVTQSLVDGKLRDEPIKTESLSVDQCVGELQLDDEGYFNSYAHYGIHYEMLSDTVRTETYRNAILDNKDIFFDARVLDVGCGTGILSMFAAKAGAKKVFAVDMSDVIYQAMDIVRENNLLDKITTLKGRLEDLDIPGGKVDIIISEWMGYFLLFEGMLDSVIYARNNHLKPGGKLLPNRCNLSIVGSGDIEHHKNLIGFWSDVYGFKMNCMKTEVIKEAVVDLAKNEHLITEPFVIAEIDINTCTIDCVNFKCDFTLKATRNGQLTSLVGYFDTFFDLPNSVQFSTGPYTDSTHWKQTIFYFREPKSVTAGEVISGTFDCSRDVKNLRGLTVIIYIFGQSHTFMIS